MYKTLPGKKKTKPINQSLLVCKYKGINFIKAGSQDTEGGPLGDKSKGSWMRSPSTSSMTSTCYYSQHKSLSFPTSENLT